MKSILPCHLSVAATLLLVACSTTSITPPPTPLADFQAFDSPRDFDPPGRVFRVNPQGVVFGVGTLALTPHTGEEVTLNISSKSNWSLETALKTMGVTAESLPAELKLEMKRDRTVTLGSVNGRREYVDDVDATPTKLQELIAAAGYRPEDRYYIIRETVATDKISYKASSTFSTDATLDAQIKKIIEDKSGLKIDRSQEFSLPLTFNKPLRVWYKTERVVPNAGSLGMGPTNAPTFTRQPTQPNEFVLPGTDPK